MRRLDGCFVANIPIEKCELEIFGFETKKTFYCNLEVSEKWYWKRENYLCIMAIIFMFIGGALGSAEVVCEPQLVGSFWPLQRNPRWDECMGEFGGESWINFFLTWNVEWKCWVIFRLISYCFNCIRRRRRVVQHILSFRFTFRSRSPAYFVSPKHIGVQFNTTISF